MKIKQRIVEEEIVIALEAGFNKHLNRSFAYSPFRLFFNMFKKNNPQTMESARERIRQDVSQILSEIENFNRQDFINQNQITANGKELFKKSYNIGINLLKKHLTVMIAFKAIRDAQTRQNIYNFVLSQIKESAIRIIELEKEKNKEIK